MANERLDRLVADMKVAMKAGDRSRLEVLRMLISDIKEAQHRADADTLDESDEIAVLQRAVKTRKETIEQAEEAGRTEIAERERAEVEIVQEYLPDLLSGEALVKRVRDVAAEIGYLGPPERGKFLKEWMSRYKGRADGREVQAALGLLG